MNKKIKLDLIAEAQKHLIDNPQNLFHEITHHYRTALYAKKISQNIEDLHDFDLVEVLCWWHDVKTGTADNINKRVAEETAEHLSKKFGAGQKEIVFDSIKNHEWGSKPKFVGGKILQDADKLEVLSEERFDKYFDDAPEPHKYIWQTKLLLTQSRIKSADGDRGGAKELAQKSFEIAKENSLKTRLSQAKLVLESF